MTPTQQEQLIAAREAVESLRARLLDERAKLVERINALATVENALSALITASLPDAAEDADEHQKLAAHVLATGLPPT